jgi:arylsulfatase A-like enzyme
MSIAPAFAAARRWLLRIVDSTGLPGLLPIASSPRANGLGAGARPNILLIVTDEERHWSRTEALIPPQLLAAFQALIPGRMRLRAQGVRLSNYFTPVAPCSPARGALYTGHHAPDNGVVDNMDFDSQLSLDPEVPTMADVLSAAGYYCAYQGKVHLAHDEDMKTALDMQRRYGFRDWQGPFVMGDVEGPLSGAMRDDDIAGHAADWLKTTGAKLRRRGRPFLLAVNLINPHDIMMLDADGPHGSAQIPQGIKPGDAGYDLASSHAYPLTPVPRRDPYFYWWNPRRPDNSDGQNGYDLATCGPRPGALDEWASILSGGFGNIDLDDRRTTPIAVYRDNDPRLGIHEIEVPLWQVYLNYYLNCIVDNDRAIARLADTLVELGMADDTLAILTSDHGELALSHMGVSRYYQAATTSDYEPPETALAQPPRTLPLRQKGSLVYHENNQVPLVVARLCDVAESLVCRLLPAVDIDTAALASSIDLLPTLLAWAGRDGAWYTQTFGRVLSAQGMLDRLPGVALDRLLAAPPEDGTAHWWDGSQGRTWVLLTGDAMESALDADYVYGLIWGQSPPPALDFGKRGCIRGIFDGTHKYVRFFSPQDYRSNGEAWASMGYAELVAAGQHGQDIQLFVHRGPTGHLEMHNRAPAPESPVALLNERLHEAMTRELARVRIPPLTVQTLLAQSRRLGRPA